MLVRVFIAAGCFSLDPKPDPSRFSRLSFTTAHGPESAGYRWNQHACPRNRSGQASRIILKPFLPDVFVTNSGGSFCFSRNSRCAARPGSLHNSYD